jgi:hypothetical protein
MDVPWTPDWPSLIAVEPELLHPRLKLCGEKLYIHCREMLWDPEDRTIADLCEIQAQRWLASQGISIRLSEHSLTLFDDHTGIRYPATPSMEGAIFEACRCLLDGAGKLSA